MVNFLVIVTDQHRADYLGCAGHPVLRTPNIDRIAARGTMFDRFHVANPVCMPNRAAILTGRHSSVSGVRHNGIPLPLEVNTLADCLRAAGFDTALIGKAHLQCTLDGAPELGPNPCGDGPLANARRRPAGNYDQEKDGPWATRGRAAMDLPYYGFDHVDLTTGHGDAAGADHLLAQRAALGDPEALRGIENQLPHTYVCPQAVRTAIPEDQHSTFWIRDRALDYLSDPARRQAPFLAFVSFPDPHHPFSPPGRYWDLYDPADMVLPDSFATHAPDPPPPLRWLRENGEPGKAAYGAALVNERQAREAMALTCGMIAMIDDAVGALLDQLDAAGLAEDTVVVFTSDHGDFLGDHGLILKGPMHYQSTVRVPLIWSDPARPEADRSGRLGSAIDLAPTILARAGVGGYWGMQGSDLFAGAGPGSVLIEDDGNRLSLGFDAPPRVRTLITERHRLTLYQDQDWAELYDLIADPGEITNLWDAPQAQALKPALLFELAQQMSRACDRSPWPDALA
ncbi:MAG: sulfatase-like hydrolase/transferase [Rhodobacter sp.]|nr:sulfatase-like hydrolase/transferase [Paracoccaceae bacterium]MCC0079212.1 sulfatase-like hydrolase/transferase [Rhodobacter sp.]